MNVAILREETKDWWIFWIRYTTQERRLFLVSRDRQRLVVIRRPDFEPTRQLQ